MPRPAVIPIAAADDSGAAATQFFSNYTQLKTRVPMAVWVAARLLVLAVTLGLAVLLILLGVYPQPVLDTSAASMQGVQQWLGGAFNQLASAR